MTGLPADGKVWEATLSGPLGDAIQRNLDCRIKTFIEDETSGPIALFGPELKPVQTSGDWYGEHAGKWLVAASRAALRTADDALIRSIRSVVKFLIEQQEPDGYLGTYAPEASSRLTAPSAAPRTWDVWNLSYLILGLVEAERFASGAVDAAARILDLMSRTFDASKSIVGFGNHNGLSAVIALDAAITLFERTHDERHLDFAKRVLDMEGAAPRLSVIEKVLTGADASELATGKAYQLIWFFTGVVKLARVTGDERLKLACLTFWENVSLHHLTLGGGPWGGIGRHSELFHPKGFFTPYGFVETCSAMSWMDLNAELLQITGEGRFADSAEITLWNTILGAQDINGSDWSYFTFPNGRRNSTYDWACCKSSGAIALESAAHRVCRSDERSVSVDLYVPGRLRLADASIRIETGYPGDPTIRVILEKAMETKLRLRIPMWAKGFELRVNGEVQSAQAVNGYVSVQRTWAPGDSAVLILDYGVQTHTAAFSIDHHGQEVMRLDYVAATFGPLVLATGLLDGFRKEETLHVPQLFPDRCFGRIATPAGYDGPAFELRPPGRKPIQFLPYYEAGGRTDGKWRLTWMQAAWQ